MKTGLRLASRRPATKKAADYSIAFRWNDVDCTVYSVLRDFH